MKTGTQSRTNGHIAFARRGLHRARGVLAVLLAAALTAGQSAQLGSALFSVRAAETTPAINWRVAAVEGTAFETEDIPVYGYSIYDFITEAEVQSGADCTAAAQTAIDLLSSEQESDGQAAGGTLYFPQGEYTFQGTLTLGKGVTLLGDWRAPSASDMSVQGTVFKVYSGRGSADGTPFITMKPNSCVRNLNFWYPEQTADNLTPYPPTIITSAKGVWGADYMHIKNVTLVNSWLGIYCTLPSYGQMPCSPTLRNIYGTPLREGVNMDGIVDIGRFDYITFSPDYWARSGLAGAPAEGTAAYQTLTDHLYQNAVGLSLGRIDWSYLTYFTVSGYREGLRFFPSVIDTSGACPNGQCYRLTFDSCQYAIYDAGVHSYGELLTFVDISGCEYGLYIAPEATASGVMEVLQMTTSNTPYPFCQLGTDTVSLMNADIQDGAVTANGAMLTCTNCDFGAGVTADFGEYCVRALLSDCRQNGTTLAACPAGWTDSTGGRLVVDGTSVTGVQTLTYQSPDGTSPDIGAVYVQDFTYSNSCKPAKSDLFVVTADTTGAADTTAAIQAKLTEAGNNGGGIVFLPPGHYLVEGTLTVPSGVELKGAVDIGRNPIQLGTILQVTSDTGNADGTARVTLEANSGLRGVVFNEPYQDYNAIHAYPYCVKGNGANVYVINVALRGVFNGVDLASTRCDNHYVEYLSGIAMHTAIQVGGGASGGVVCNTQMNLISLVNGNESKFGSWPNDADGKIVHQEGVDGWLAAMRTAVNTYLYNYADNMVVGNVTDEMLFDNFSFSGVSGIHFTEASSGWMIGQGVDSAIQSIRVDAAVDMPMVNTQLVAVNQNGNGYVDTPSYHVVLGESAGSVTLYNTALWGNAGGYLNLAGGSLQMNNCTFRDFSQTNFGTIASSSAATATLVNAQINASGKTLMETNAQALTITNLYSTGALTYNTDTTRNAYYYGEDWVTPLYSRRTRVEAELAATTGSVKSASCEDAEGGGQQMGNTATGDTLTYTLSVKEAGTYRLTMRTSAPDANKTVQIAVNGTAQLNTVTIPQTGEWKTYTTFDAGLLTLTQGTNTLKLTITNAPFNLNWLELTRVFPLSAAASTRLSAADYESCSVDSASAAPSAENLTAGDTAAWRVDATANGTWQLTLAASGGEAARVALMSGEQTLATVMLPKSGTARTAASDAFSLTAGEQSLTLKVLSGAVSLTALTFTPATVSGKTSGNPIITTLFTADPSAHVFNDRLYIYASHDMYPNQGCDLMDKYHIFSTANMVDWVDEGEVLSSEDAAWSTCSGFMWAPDCVYNAADGKYYLYYPHPADTNWNDTWRIGVAVGDTPVGPFTDLGCVKNADGTDFASMIDPCVFQDDDGSLYLFVGGGGRVCYARLSADMISLDEPMTYLSGIEDFHEGSWVFKKDGTYYLMYADNYAINGAGRNQQRYATAASLSGPWTSQGVLLLPTDCDTSHGSICQYKGNWYLFYHDSSLSNGIGPLRSVCVAQLTFNADGTIAQVNPNEQTDGVAAVGLAEDVSPERDAHPDPDKYTQLIYEDTTSRELKGQSVQSDAITVTNGSYAGRRAMVRVTYSANSTIDAKVRSSGDVTGGLEGDGYFLPLTAGSNAISYCFVELSEGETTTLTLGGGRNSGNGDATYTVSAVEVFVMPADGNVVNRGELARALRRADGNADTTCTAGTAAAYATALETAWTVYYDAAATQVQVDDALAKLLAAQEALKPLTATLTLTVAGIDAPSLVGGGGVYDLDTVHVITAAQTDGYAFAGWYNAAGERVTAHPVTTVHLTADTALTARYVPVTVVGAGTTRMEAESFFDAISGEYDGYGVKREACSDEADTAQGIQGQDVGFIDGGDWMEYAILVEQSGYYTITLRGSTDNVETTGTTGGIVALLADGETLVESQTVAPTAGWQVYGDNTTGKVWLDAGRHIFRVNVVQAGINLNWIAFNRYDVLHVEAEGFDTAVSGTQWNGYAIENEPCGDAGGGEDVGHIDGGDWTRYTVYVETAGVYTFSLRAAAEATGAWSTQLLQGNENGAALATAAVSQTGGWQVYETFAGDAAFYLNAGTQILTLKTATGGQNWNWFELALQEPGRATSGTQTREYSASEAERTGNVTYNANGYLENLSAETGSATFTVDGGSGGEATVTVTYASANDTGYLNVSVNGDTANPTQMAIVSTGGWNPNEGSTTSSFTVTLNEGSNALTFYRGNGSGANISAITVTTAVSAEQANPADTGAVFQVDYAATWSITTSELGMEETSYQPLTYQGRYGTLTVAKNGEASTGAVLTYTVTAAMTGSDAFALTITGRTETVPLVFSPASSLYYEAETLYANPEAFGASFTGVWAMVNDTDAPVTAFDETTLTPNVETTYGQGGNKEFQYTNGNGGGMALTGSGQRYIAGEQPATVFTFSFAGTGVDMYAKLGTVSGEIRVLLYDGSGALRRAQWIDPGCDQDRYQVPVVQFMDLDYGSYQVQVLVYPEGNAFTGERYQLTLDGVRVYQPLGDVSYGDEERVQFLSLRNMLLESTASVEAGSAASGVAVVGYVSATEKEKYQRQGPKSELYLLPGETLTFEVADPCRVQIGMHLLNVSEGVHGAITVGSADIPVLSTMDMYYKIESSDFNQATGKKIYTITNTGSTVLALTKLKLTNLPEEATGGTLVTVTANALAAAETQLAQWQADVVEAQRLAALADEALAARDTLAGQLQARVDACAARNPAQP